MELKVISLFSGYGTQELALKYANINHETIANCDNFKTANIAYDSLHKTTHGNLGDIREVNENALPDCDFMSYSFPCQDISISGIQKGIQEGTRSGLLYEVERLLGIKKPKYLMMENVKNLVSSNHMDKFQTHIQFLNDIGYGCHWLVLNGADFGCPQNRERVFMMSVLGSTNEEVKEIMTSVLKHKKDRISMSGFLEEEVPNELYIDCEYEPHTPTTKSVCRLVGRRTDVKYDQARRVYSPEGCSPCLTTTGSPQILTNDGRVRKITAREAYRFMGVKDEDIDNLVSTDISTQAHVALAGNSICVPVMKAIFTEFFAEYITEESKETLMMNNI